MKKPLMTLLMAAAILPAAAQSEYDGPRPTCGAPYNPQIVYQRPAAPPDYSSDPLAGLTMSDESREQARTVIEKRATEREKLQREYEADMLKLQKKYKEKLAKVNVEAGKKLKKIIPDSEYDRFLSRDGHWTVKSFEKSHGQLPVQPGPPMQIMTK